jgi:hypothetical protein
LAGVITITEVEVAQHLGEVVRSTVEETLNALLEAEADTLCGARRYKRSAERQDTTLQGFLNAVQLIFGQMLVVLRMLLDAVRRVLLQMPPLDGR